MYMVSNLSKFEEVNVLASEANWAWPEALRSIFRPRGVNLLVAENATEFVHVIKSKRIHTTIVDMDSETSNGLATIKIIRMSYPLLPCILLTSRAGQSLLDKALRLDVFSVINNLLSCCRRIDISTGLSITLKTSSRSALSNKDCPALLVRRMHGSKG